MNSFEKWVISCRPYCEIGSCMNPSKYIINPSSNMQAVCEDCMFPEPFPRDLVLAESGLVVTAKSSESDEARVSTKLAGRSNAEVTNTTRGGENPFTLSDQEIDELYHQEPINDISQLPANEEPEEDLESTGLLKTEIN